MDKSLIRNGIIKKLDTNTKYLYSLYAYDNNRKYNVLFIVTDKSLYLWEDIGQNLTIKIKQYKNISKITLTKGTLFLNFEDENFTLSQISKEDGEIIMFYRFIKDFYDKTIDTIVRNANNASNNQTPSGPSMFKKRTEATDMNRYQHNQNFNEKSVPNRQNNFQNNEIADINNKRLESLTMFSTEKSPIKKPTINNPANGNAGYDNSYHSYENNGVTPIENNNSMQHRNQMENKMENQRKNTFQNNNQNKNSENYGQVSDKKKKSKLPLIIAFFVFIVLIIVGVIGYFIVLPKLKSDNIAENKNVSTNTTDKTNNNKDNIYTKTQKEAEIKLEDLNNLETILKKDKVIYASMQLAYEKYKENPNDFDYDAMKHEIDAKFDEYKDVSIYNVKLKSLISGNVEGNYIYEELKKNEGYLNDIKTSLYLNFNNKFSDNGRVVELETLLENMMSSNQTIYSLIKGEKDIFEKELQKYGTGDINDSNGEIDVEDNEELIGNKIEN